MFMGRDEPRWTLEPVWSVITGCAPLILPEFNYPTGPTACTRAIKTPLDMPKLFLTSVIKELVLSAICSTERPH